MTVLALPGIGDDPVVPYVLSAFTALVYYNAIELLVLCLATFKRRGSTYFWCLMVTTLSLIPLNTGYVLLFFRPNVSGFLDVSLIVVGWCGTVSGHSLVLWSRLHLVLQNTKVLHGLLVMIIVDAVLLHIPIIVLLFGSVSSHPSTFAVGYNIMERIQLVVFCLQEFTLSGLYVWETAKMLRLRRERYHHRILVELLIINVIVLIIDLVVVIMEYAGFYAAQVTFKPFAYSIKLKLEYAVLGKLVQIAQGGSSGSRTFDTVPSSEYDGRTWGESSWVEMHEGSKPNSAVPLRSPQCS